VLGVVISADLGLEKHAANVSATCFYHLRQLRHIRRTLSNESAATLVHAFVMSRVDYRNVVFAGAPKSTTNKLQRVMNSAARVVSGSRKYDRGLTQLYPFLRWGYPKIGHSPWIRPRSIFSKIFNELLFGLAL